MNTKKIGGLALALGLTAFGAQAQEMNIPGTWQHQQNGGQQIFTAPGGAEGVSINPAPEMARLGGPMNVLTAVLNQFHGQYPTLKVMASCQTSADMAVAFVERPGQAGPVSERVMAGTGQGSVSIIVEWAPTSRFAADDRQLTGGKPACR